MNARPEPANFRSERERRRIDPVDIGDRAADGGDRVAQRETVVEAGLAADDSLEAVRKGMEDRYWVHDRDVWRRVFFVPKSSDDEEWE